MKSAGGGRKRKAPAQQYTNPPPKRASKVEAPFKLQLYVSQLPFDTDKGKIVKHFEARGCTVSRKHGIRLISEKGVAFIDAIDAASHAAGLKLHRKAFGGRLLNVRPMKTKDELARIVEEKKKVLGSWARGINTDIFERPDGNRNEKNPRNSTIQKKETPKVVTDEVAVVTTLSQDLDRKRGNNGEEKRDGKDRQKKEVRASKSSPKKTTKRKNTSTATATKLQEKAKNVRDGIPEREKWTKSKKKRERQKKARQSASSSGQERGQ